MIEVRPLSEEAEAELRVQNPRIYYGEETIDYVIVKTQTEELDYQAAGEELKSTTYFGSGGIEMSSIIRRAAYAWEFTDINILISPEIQTEEPHPVQAGDTGADRNRCAVPATGQRPVHRGAG